MNLFEVSKHKRLSIQEMIHYKGFKRWHRLSAYPFIEHAFKKNKGAN